MLKCAVIKKHGKADRLNLKGVYYIMEDAILLFADIVRDAIPYAIAFTLGQFIVNSFMHMAFGGKIKI